MATKVSEGRYKASVFVGYDKDKKRKYKVFYAPTSDEADFIALEFKLGKAKKAVDNKITVAECIDNYIESKYNILAAKTISGYKQFRRLYFQQLMPIKLCDLDNFVLQRAINDEFKAHSAKTIKLSFGLISSSIRVIQEFNPRVTLPKELPIEYKTPDAETLSKIINASKGTRLEIPILLSAWLSLRASEICGLRWEDVRDGYIYVCNARVLVEGENVEKTTKNASSTRKIPLPGYIKDVLDKQEHTSKYVCDTNGNALGKAFSKFLQRNDLPHCRFHDLRHANASVMVMLGVPDRYAQERGGWSNSATLSKRYQQTFSDESVRVANKIDGFFDEMLHAEK